MNLATKKVSLSITHFLMHTKTHVLCLFLSLGNLSLERESLVSFFKFSAQHSSSQDVIIGVCVRERDVDRGKEN